MRWRIDFFILLKIFHFFSSFKGSSEEEKIDFVLKKDVFDGILNCYLK